MNEDRCFCLFDILKDCGIWTNVYMPEVLLFLEFHFLSYTLSFKRWALFLQLFHTSRVVDTAAIPVHFLLRFNCLLIAHSSYRML